MTNHNVTTPRFQNRHLHSLTEKKALAFIELFFVSVQYRIMALPRSDKRRSAGAAGSGHPIKAPVRSLSYLFDTFALLCHTCESWFKVFCCQVLSRDVAATLSTLAGELNRSDSEDTLEEQAAVLLQLPRKLEDVCAQLCEKLQKVPLPALGQVAAP